MEKKERVEIRYRLAELLDAFDLKQHDLAERTGISESVISQYLSGKRLPRQDKIAIIADTFDVEPAWLMGYDIGMSRTANSKRAEKEFELTRKYRLLSDRDKAVIDKMIDSMLESY